MPSANVSKALDAMKNDPALVKALNEKLEAIFQKAKVQLGVQEKQEFLVELSKLVDLPDPYVHVHWT